MKCLDNLKNKKGAVQKLTNLKTIDMCNCKNVKTGSHEACVIVDLPPYIAKILNKKQISVDSCIAEEVKELHKKGMVTIGSCCGHNNKEPYIQVHSCLIVTMMQLGYEFCENQSVSPGFDCFKPKTV